MIGILACAGLLFALLLLATDKWDGAPAWLGEGILWGEILVAAGVGIVPMPDWHPAATAALLCSPSALVLPWAGGDPSFILVSLFLVAATYGAATAAGLATRALGRRHWPRSPPDLG
jgi:hypothetical protein